MPPVSPKWPYLQILWCGKMQFIGSLRSFWFRLPATVADFRESTDTPEAMVGQQETAEAATSLPRDHSALTAPACTTGAGGAAAFTVLLVVVEFLIYSPAADEVLSCQLDCNFCRGDFSRACGCSGGFASYGQICCLNMIIEKINESTL